MVSKVNHPQIALFQVSEILQFTQINAYIYIHVYVYVYAFTPASPQAPMEKSLLVLLPAASKAQPQ